MHRTEKPNADVPATTTARFERRPGDRQRVDTKEAQRRLDRLRKLADSLDSRFRIPGTPVRVGWDSILGLVPGLGDAVTALPALYMIQQANRMGVRRAALTRMAGNAGIDFVVGGVPVLGDVFDLFFKGHRRNIALLERELGMAAQTERQT
jgi:hypothetical protein